MLNKNTINILNKDLLKNGIKIDFYRRQENDYGEIDYNTELTFAVSITGIFHESNNFFNIVQTTDGSRTETKKTPAILTQYDNLQNLKINDICIINGTKYKIISFYDIDLSNKFIDISLELIFNE